jgi:EpsI family protein
VLAAHLFLRSWPRRLVFVGLSVAIPILANGVRAYGIIMLAHLSDYRIAIDVDHVLYGFVFLAFVTLCLLGIAALLRDRDGPAEAAPAGPTADSQELRQRPTPRYTLATQAVWSGVAVAVVLLAQAWAAAAKEAPADLTPALLLPEAAAPWQAVANGEPAWKPRFHGNDVTLQGAYRLGDDQVDLYVAYYGYQREGAEAIGDMNDLVGAARQWRTVQLRQAEGRIKGRDHPYVRMLLANRGDSYVVWYWYRVGGENTNSQPFGKLLELKALMTSGEQSASVIAIGSRVSEDAQRTDALLEAFLDQNLNSDGTLFRFGSARAGTGAAASP